MEILISRIRKNASEEIWIALSTYEGHDLFNIRAYFRGLDGFQPTRKGVALGVGKLAELHEALKSATAMATEDKPLVIQKNSTEEIRVFQSQYMGHMLMNIRVFFFRNGKGTIGEPSHKGIAFNVNLTPEIIRAVELAMTQVKSSEDNKT